MELLQQLLERLWLIVLKSGLSQGCYLLIIFSPWDLSTFSADFYVKWFWITSWTVWMLYCADSVSCYSPLENNIVFFLAINLARLTPCLFMSFVSVIWISVKFSKSLLYCLGLPYDCIIEGLGRELYGFIYRISNLFLKLSVL